MQLVFGKVAVVQVAGFVLPARHIRASSGEVAHLDQGRHLVFLGQQLEVGDAGVGHRLLQETRHRKTDSQQLEFAQLAPLRQKQGVEQIESNRRFDLRPFPTAGLAGKLEGWVVEPGGLCQLGLTDAEFLETGQQLAIAQDGDAGRLVGVERALQQRLHLPQHIGFGRGVARPGGLDATAAGEIDSERVENGLRINANTARAQEREPCRREDPPEGGPKHQP